LIVFLLSHRTAAISCLLLITLLSCGFVGLLHVDPGVESLLPAEGKNLRVLREFNATFASDEIIVLALHSPRLFSTEGLKRLDGLTREAERLPNVTRVLSPTNAKDLEGDALGPFPLVPYERVAKGEWSPEELGRRLAAHPLFGGLLVSSDASTAAILIEVRRLEGNPKYRARLVAQIRQLAAAGAAGMEVHVAGIPVEKVDVADYVKREQRIFAPLIFGLLALVTLLLYRHPAGMLVPLGVVAASLVWTLGLYAAAGRPLNPVTSLITPVVLVVSVAGSIHFLNHYLGARAEGLWREPALERAFRVTRVPCFNAAFTTAIGFGSLLVLPIPAIRDFGMFTAAGVMISYLLTMALTPLLISLLPDFPPRVTRKFKSGPIERALRATIRITCRHPLLATAAAVAVLTVSALGLSRIHTETDLIRSLRRDSPLARATRFIDSHLTGVNSLEILVRGVPLDDPAALARVASFEEKVRSMPGVRKVTGLPDLVSRVNRALHEGNDDFAKLPEGPEAREDLADIGHLLKERAPAELARFVAPGHGTPRLAARVTALGSAASQQPFARIRRASTLAGLPGIALTGNFVVLSDMSTSLVSNQMRGLAPALLLILAAMAVQLRSLRLGLLSAIPTGAPVLMTYGLMGWLGIPLSVSTAMIASITLGMTDDNTIHLLARFREEFARDGDYEIALAAMMDTSGRAVLFSTLTVAAGFWVGAFSSFLPSVHFAVLTGLTLLLGLLCEAVLLPLTLILFRPLGKPALPGEAPGSRAALAILAWLPMLSFAGTAASAPRAEVLLRDQYGRADGPARHAGIPLLLLYGQPPDLRGMRSWEVRILEKAGSGFQVMRAVDARGVKGKRTEAEVNHRLQRNVPQEIAVLVDWDGELARAYALPDRGLTVTVLDSKGKACATVSGPVRDMTLTRLLDALAQVRAKGACP